MLTQEQLRVASKLWKQGKIGREIAAAVGIKTGKLFELASKNRDLFPYRPSNALRALAFGRPPIRAKAVKPHFPPKAPGYSGVLIGRLTAGCCTFPLWGHHEQFDAERSFYCGAIIAPETVLDMRSNGTPVVLGEGGYCDFHARLARGKRRAAAA